MIFMELTENSIFTHANKKLLGVGIWQHRDGRFKGPAQYVGFLEFPNREVAKMFHEQMEMMLEIGEWEKEEKDNEL